MRRTCLTALCVLAGGSAGLAAEATGEGAQGLAETFHRYLGPARAGQADFVRVEPAGENYRVTFDLDEFARPLAPFGLSLDPAEVSFLTQPLADGTWHVSGLEAPNSIVAHANEQTVTYRLDGITFDGIYDSTLAAFIRFEETVSPLSMSTEAPGVKMSGTYGTQTIHGTAAASGADSVSGSVTGVIEGFGMKEFISLPASDPDTPPVPPFDISYSVGSTKADVSFEAVKSPKLLELWGYAIAHAQETPPKLDNAEIKAMLTGLLPVFQRIEEKASGSNLHVGTPLGDFGVANLDFDIVFPGLVSNGETSFAMKLAGPTYPEAVVPAWAKQLVPSDAEFGFGLSGFDLDAPARALIEKLDVSRKPPLADADFADAAKLVAPAAGVKLTLEPTHVHGPILDIQASGEMILSMPEPTGSFSVSVKGLDEAIALLKSAGDDPMASQALASLTLLQSLGRPESDGSISYAIEAKEDGSVSVNGQTMKPPTSKAL